MKPTSPGINGLITLATLTLLLLPLHPPHALRASAQGDTRKLSQQVETVTALPAQAKRWALVIGVDQYRDSQISPLKGATNDARTLADALVQFAGFPRDQVILLATDQPAERQPTRINILRRLSNLASIVPPDGLLLVSFAGHGMERQGRAFLIPSDAQLSDDIDFVEETAISVTRMKDRIKATGVQQILLLLDACRNDPAGRADAPNPLTEAYVKGFNFDVRNREVTAFATIYATAVGYRAYESGEKRQGYFTLAVVEALSGAAANDKGEVTLAALVKYVQETVPKRVSVDLGTNKQQKPFAVIDGYKADELVIAAVPPHNAETVTRSRLATKPTATPKPKSVSLPTPPPKLKPTSTSRVAHANVIGPPVPLVRFNFSTAKVDEFGGITNHPGQAAMGFVEELGGGMTLEMVEIPGGKFLMGFPSTSTYDGQYGNQHQAKVSSFFIGKYEVTQAQWRVVASLPKVNMDLYTNPAFFKGDNLPVEQVSWDEAIEFCVRLSRKTGRVYSLPSETEWEYACRTETNRSFSKGRTIVDWINSNSSKQRVETFPFGFGSTITPEIVNYNGSRPFGSGPIGINRQKTVPVGSLSVTNAFGLFDLHGNVEEWCLDGGSEYRVMRGGSWKSDGTQCRSASRRFEERDTKDSTLGLRVVCEASIKQ